MNAAVPSVQASRPSACSAASRRFRSSADLPGELRICQAVRGLCTAIPRRARQSRASAPPPALSPCLRASRSPERHPARPGPDIAYRAGRMKILDPILNDLTPRHIEIYWRYQVVRTGVDFGAATCFVAGSACFFFTSLSTTADWLFLIGSVLFATKPTIDMVRSLQLRRLPTEGAGRSSAASGSQRHEQERM